MFDNVWTGFASPRLGGRVERTIFDSDHQAFRAMVRDFAVGSVAPHLPAWEDAGQVDRELFVEAGRIGLLGLNIATDDGGGGVDDFRFNVVLNEELSAVGAAAVVMNICGFNDIIGPYFEQLCDPNQRKRWLPALCSGRAIAAIAMTEPSGGSDLKAISTVARRDGDDYLITGSKTFISNGIIADLIIVVASTDPTAGARGLSLFVVEDGMPGFARGARLEKLGLRAQDTAELYFDDVRVPRSNLLGDEGAAFGYLLRNLVRERLSVSVTAVRGMRRAFEHARSFAQSRHVFGQALAEFQATKFTLAEIATEVEVATSFLDRCIDAHVRGTLSDVEAAMCKWWVTELQQRVVARSLQMHGGYGYMRDYDIARDFVDARASTLYAGTTEVMKEIIGRSLTRT